MSHKEETKGNVRKVIEKVTGREEVRRSRRPPWLQHCSLCLV